MIAQEIQSVEPVERGAEANPKAASGGHGADRLPCSREAEVRPRPEARTRPASVMQQQQQQQQRTGRIRVRQGPGLREAVRYENASPNSDDPMVPRRLKRLKFSQSVPPAPGQILGPPPVRERTRERAEARRWRAESDHERADRIEAALHSLKFGS